MSTMISTVTTTMMTTIMSSMLSREAWPGREFVWGRLCRTKRISSNLKGDNEDDYANDDDDDFDW